MAKRIKKKDQSEHTQTVGTTEGSDSVRRDEAFHAQDVDEALLDSAEEALEDAAMSNDDVDSSDNSDEEENFEASDGDDSESEGEIADGERKRKKRGKRQIIFDCASIVTLAEDDPDQQLSAGEQGLVLEEVAVTMPAEGQIFDPAGGREEAIEIFKSKYGIKPVKVRGPYYIHKGIVQQPRKRETINASIAKEAEFTAQRGSAVHRFKNVDWKVIVNFTTKEGIVWVFYDGLVNPKDAPKDKTKLQKPSAKFLPITALRDIRKNTDVAA